MEITEGCTYIRGEEERLVECIWDMPLDPRFERCERRVTYHDPRDPFRLQRTVTLKSFRRWARKAGA